MYRWVFRYDSSLNRFCRRNGWIDLTRVNDPKEIKVSIISEIAYFNRK